MPVKTLSIFKQLFQMFKGGGKSLPIIFRLLFFSVVANAQSNVKFTHLTNLNGLSQSTVQAILKDKQGFMWFGTQDGLNRYDGYTFRAYRHIPKDSTSLRRSHILSLYEDRQGNVWVGTYNGALSLYDRNKDAFIHFKEAIGDRPGLSQKTVTAIYEDKQNNLWIGTYWKLNLLNRKTGKIAHFGNDPADPNSISNDGISCIFEDNKANLWIGTSNGLNILDRKTKKFKRFFHTNEQNSLSDNQIRSIFQDSRGRLWVGTNNGLNLYDHASNTFRRYQQIPGDPNSLGNNQVVSIQEADNGNLWLGTTSYLEYFDVGRNHFTHFGSNPNVPTTLSKNGNVTSLYHDKDGILWVGTYQGGINKFDEHLKYFDTYQNNPNDWNSLSFNVITAFAETSKGDIWIGTGGGGLNLWKRASNTFIRYNPDPNNLNSLANWGVISLYQGKKNNYLWIGMYGSCIDRYDPKTNTFKHYTKGNAPNQLNNDAVYAILEDRKGQVWLGTNGGGVNILNQETGVITKYLNDPNNPNSLGGNYVRCFLEDKKGNIWIGSTGGTSMFNPETRTFTNYNQNTTNIESDVVFSLFEDSKGNMWIGTLGGGLNKLNLKTKKITSYTTQDGLADNTINGILEDKQGYLWISTNNGMSRFDPRNETFKNSGLENGVQSFEFSQGAALKTKAGDLIFGGINGFNVINPDSLVYNNHIPPVVITGFRLFNKPVTVGGEQSPLQQDILTTKEIYLNYDQSFITFEFAALGFTAPEKNEYAYKLEGFDDDWNYSGNTRTATYTNLSPGNYTFKVKASNNDGVWNEEGCSIKIVVAPPVWQTWWFELLVALIVTGCIVLLYKYRVRAIKRQQILLEKQVRERTESLSKKTREERQARREADEANQELERKNRELEQFAYVASHDMQEPLRTISSFVELLQKQYQGNLDDRADKYMNFIMQASERMKVLISDLLEYSRIGKKKELSVVDCNMLLKEVLADLGKAINEAGAEIKSGSLPIVLAYPTEMKQLLQNLISNALKFKKKDTPPQIQIHAKQVDGHWQFSVSDNCIGIDPKHNERIFAIFQRLHTRSEYEGSGIGLANCKKIAELHGGKIWVESTVGEGSNFHFTIREGASVTTDDRSSTI